MAHVITNVGEDWFADRAVKSGFNEYLDIVGVGTGNTAPSNSDTQLDNEEYRASKSNSNVTVETTSNIGEVRCTISITGGTEVTAGSDIWEFGLFSDGGTLLYREVRDSAVTVESGETSTFEFKITVTE